MGEMAIPAAGERVATRVYAREVVASVELDEAAPAPISPGPSYNHTRGDSHLGPCAHCKQMADLQQLAIDQSQEIVLLIDQLDFIRQAIQTASQTAVPVDTKVTILREIYEATLGNLPDWWPAFKKEHGVGG